MLSFATPLVLSALIFLPILYYLLRLTPPPPRLEPLPTLPLVRDLIPQTQKPNATPWWLLLLRLLIAALLILAMAEPIWNAQKSQIVDAKTPLVVVIDNGWAAAHDWQERVDSATRLIESASDRPVYVRGTAAAPGSISPVSSSTALDVLRSLTPQAFTPDRKAQFESLAAFVKTQPDAEFVWISDGVSVGGCNQLLTPTQILTPTLTLPLTGRGDSSEPSTSKTPSPCKGEGWDGGQNHEFEDLIALIGVNKLTIIQSPAPNMLGLAHANNAADALNMHVLRAIMGVKNTGIVQAFDIKGHMLGEANYKFETDTLDTVARFDLPLELRNEVSRLEIVNEHSAGAVTLLDDNQNRRRVGVLTGESSDNAQPFVSSAYFLRRALEPFADIREASKGAPNPIQRLIEDQCSVIILADSGALTGDALQQLTDFVDKGGMLVRFAGAKLTTNVDALLPVKLRQGGRILGGALSWESPRKLGAYPETSPFVGLVPQADVTVQRQVLAEPDADLPARIWAQLEDGTPLITGLDKGAGTLVFFHVTADTTWSNLPLSGQFVDVLHKLVMRAHARGVQSGFQDLAAPNQILDGFGVLQNPPVYARSVSRGQHLVATPEHPAGFYGAAESSVAVNILADDAQLVPLILPTVKILPLEQEPPLHLRSSLLVFALLLLILDAIALMVLSGALSRTGRKFINLKV